MAEGTIGSFFTKINNEVEKQMNDDLKKLVLMLMNCYWIKSSSAWQNFWKVGERIVCN